MNTWFEPRTSVLLSFMLFAFQHHCCCCCCTFAVIIVFILCPRPATDWSSLLQLHRVRLNEAILSMMTVASLVHKLSLVRYFFCSPRWRRICWFLIYLEKLCYGKLWKHDFVLLKFCAAKICWSTKKVQVCRSSPTELGLTWPYSAQGHCKAYIN